MKKPSWELRGKRVNKYKSRGGRWGPGKVHLVEYLPRPSVYGLACRQLSDLDAILGGIEPGNVGKDAEVTCKKCRKKYGLDEKPAVKRKVRIVRRVKK